MSKRQSNVKILFSERLRELLQAHLLTKTQLANAIGVSSSTIGAWLCGTKPSVRNLCKVAVYFGESVDYLVGRKNK